MGYTEIESFIISTFVQICTDFPFMFFIIAYSGSVRGGLAYAERRKFVCKCIVGIYKRNGGMSD